jgi:hypothetical protein
MSAVVNNMDSTPLLLVNRAPNKNHWLGIITQGTGSNRDGIGAKVTVSAGGRKYVQEVRSGSSYISSNDLRLHFGLGASQKVDGIEVRWPDGKSEVFPAADADHFITLVEGKSKLPLTTK